MKNYHANPQRVAIAVVSSPKCLLAKPAQPLHWLSCEKMHTLDFYTLAHNTLSQKTSSSTLGHVHCRKGLQLCPFCKLDTLGHPLVYLKMIHTCVHLHSSNWRELLEKLFAHGRGCRIPVCPVFQLNASQFSALLWQSYLFSNRVISNYNLYEYSFCLTIIDEDPLKSNIKGSCRQFCTCSSCHMQLKNMITRYGIACTSLKFICLNGL